MPRIVCDSLTPMLSVGRLEPGERHDWEALFRSYIDFCQRDEPQSMYDRAWEEFRASERMHALGARADGRLIGIVHYLIHPSTSSRDVCYLQDLYTDQLMRGRGVARALIAAVADEAATYDCERVYWTTQVINAAARRLYDQVAEDRGSMVYILPLDPR
jgi:GNAT superfamily N-acetyltransferase